jgi:hypothetical protein
MNETQRLPVFTSAFTPNSLPVHAVMAMPMATDIEASRAVTQKLPRL